MSIRLKITLGFVLLTIVVISAVSFWAAQSLGFSVDSSDFAKLETLKKQIIKSLATQQKHLNRICKDTARSFSDLDMLPKNPMEQHRYTESLKNNLDLDWLEVFVDDRPIINNFY